MVNGLVPPREAEDAYDAIRAQRDALAKALRAVVAHLAAEADEYEVRYGERPTSTPERQARAALALVGP
jgi:hypothetical protein